ncbi:hypothetical protein, partial [Thermotoga sp.]|uniref:hypothetical protein n=1 Tax=Thermotoga sp. TaxID=28240 RepID=UPI0025F19995
KKARATRIAVQLRNLEQGIEQYLMATLPSTNDLLTIDLKSKLLAGEFADSEILNDSKLQQVKAIPDEEENEIVIVLEYDVGNAALAELVKGTLVETYGPGSGGYPNTSSNSPADFQNEGVFVDNQNDYVAIVKRIEAFWW